METVNTQTAVFLVSASIYALLKTKYGIVPDIVAGHSLGEYSALYAAGGISFPDALYLLKKRAQFMEEVTLEQQGSMLAVLNFPLNILQSIVAQYDRAPSLEAVAEVVNINGPTQLVVSGTINELASIKSDVESRGGKALMLKVSGGFHSRLMLEAQKRFSLYLEKVDFHDLSIPLVSNVDARSIQSAQEVASALVRQISAPVCWWQSMEAFKDCDCIIEIAPGSKLSSLLKREWPDKQIVAVNEPKDLEQLLPLLGKEMPVEDELPVIEEPSSGEQLFHE